MFMHAGFAMLETGSCRVKNASNVLMKNLVNVSWSGVDVLCFFVDKVFSPLDPDSGLGMHRHARLVGLRMGLCLWQPGYTC